MDKDILFRERQRFSQWWVWAILIGLNGILIFGFFWQVIGGKNFGNNPLSNSELAIAVGISAVVTILFANFRLETKIASDGIYVRLFPIHIKFKRYPWSDISKCFVRKYSAMSEYGGWGYRLGGAGKGRALNISGDMGLQLEFVNKKKLLIGTKKPEELRKVLEKIEAVKP